MPLRHGRPSSDPMTEWEKCVMMKLRMRRGTTLQMIGSIWNRCRTTVGAYITEWVPKWEMVGSYLSELDLAKRDQRSLLMLTKLMSLFLSMGKTL